MLRIFFVVLIAIVVAEFALIVQVATMIGVLETIVVAIGTGLVGLYILSGQGKRLLAQFQSKVAQGEQVNKDIGEGLWMLIAAFLLLMPGLLSDVIGCLLLIPPVRLFLVNRGLAPKTPFNQYQQTYQNQSRPDDAIEGEYRQDK